MGTVENEWKRVEGGASAEVPNVFATRNYLMTPTHTPEIFRFGKTDCERYSTAGNGKNRRFLCFAEEKHST